MTIATPEPELDGVLAELLSDVRSVLADRFVGMYLHGSLVLGDFDRHSDVDFVVAVDRAVDDAQRAALQALHARVYALESPWARHLEGSYLTTSALRRWRAENPPHLYLDHGSSELVESHHDNTVLHRHVLREHGIALAGPAPASLIDRSHRSSCGPRCAASWSPGWGPSSPSPPSSTTPGVSRTPC